LLLTWEKTASETHEMLKTAFGDNAMGGFSHFKCGETSAENCEY
jgi:hypothetical protein